MKKIKVVVLIVLMLSLLVACNNGNDMPFIGIIKNMTVKKSTLFRT